MQLYSLTDMTGKRSDDDRTMSVMTVNVRPKVLLVGVLSMLVSLPVMMILWPLLHEIAVLAIPAVVGGSLWLFTANTNDSRQISNFRALGDRVKAKNASGKIYVGLTEININQSDEFISMPGSLPKDKAQEKAKGRTPKIDDVFK